MSQGENYISMTKNVCLVAALFTVSAMIYAGKPWQNFNLIGLISLLVFVAWAVSPYVLLHKRASIYLLAKQNLVIFVCSILVACFGIYCIIDIFIHSDPQNGIVFVFLPGLQWIGVASAIIISNGNWAKSNK